MKKDRNRKMMKPTRKLPKLLRRFTYVPIALLPAYEFMVVVNRAIPYFPSQLFKVFSPGEGLVEYCEIGKQARDLLFTDYKSGFNINMNFGPFSANVTGDNATLNGHSSALMKYRSLNARLIYGMDNVLQLRSTINGVAPGIARGLSCSLSAFFPDQNSSKISMHYLHRHANANFTTSLGLFQNSLLDFSGVIGNHIWSLGMEGSVDVSARNFKSLNLGLSCVFEKFTVSFNSYHIADLLKVSFYQSEMNSACAVELSRRRSTDTNAISIGYEHSFGSDFLVKSRVDNTGMVSGLFQYKWNPGTFYKISAEGGRNQPINFGLAASFTS